jgi:hypothetical protein
VFRFGGEAALSFSFLFSFFRLRHYFRFFLSPSILKDIEVLPSKFFQF